MVKALRNRSQGLIIARTKLAEQKREKHSTYSGAGQRHRKKNE